MNILLPLHYKGYLNKQSDADHGNGDGCQLVTQKRDNSSNSFDFRLVYSLYRFTENYFETGGVRLFFLMA